MSQPNRCALHTSGTPLPPPSSMFACSVRVTFDAEETHPVEQQRQGWQAILDTFRRYVDGEGR